VEIIRGRLSSQDFSNPALRYNPDTDLIEYSPDGGTTWNNAPEYDPRHASIYLYPPLVSSDVRCDAAANMVKWMKDFIDSLTELLEAGALAFALVNKALEIMALVFDPSVLLLLITEACETIFGIGGTALLAAFTPDQYELLLCIFYCNLGLNGRTSAAGLARIESQVGEQLNTVAALVVNLLLLIQGEVGLSNAGTLGAETGDCSDCDCDWCYTFFFDDSDGGWTLRSAWEGLYTGAAWIAIYSSADAGKNVVIEHTIPSGTILKSMTLNFDYVLGSTGGCPAGETRGAFLRYLNSGGDYINTANSALPLDTGSYDNTIALIATNTPVKVQVNIWCAQCDHSDGAVTIHSVTLRGEGDNPFGTDNCI